MTALPSNDSSVALAELRPPPIDGDGELARSRLLSAMFGATSPAPRFGRFELRERVGEGGMGVVYRAWAASSAGPTRCATAGTAELEAGPPGTRARVPAR